MAETTETFGVEYFGPALEDHRMSVMDLGPALIGLGRLCHRANDVAVAHSSVEVNIAATRSASFEVLLELIVRDPEAVIGYALTATNLLQSVGLMPSDTVKGLFQLMKWRGRESIESISRHGDDYRLLSIGNRNIIANNLTINLFQDPQARKAVKEIVSPVDSTDGVSGVRVRDERGATHFEIAKNDVPFYEVVPEEMSRLDTLPPEGVSETWVLIWRAVLIGRGRWGLVYGGRRVEARFSDTEFIDTHSVGRGDRLKVRMSTEYVYTESGDIRPAFEVQKVLEHVARSEPEPIQSDLL